MKSFHVLNFSHPFTDAQQRQLREILSVKTTIPVEDIHLNIQTIRVQIAFDSPASLHEQMRDIIDGIGWDAEAWQTTPFLVRLPALTDAASVALADIHGRAGYFPSVITFKRVGDAVPPVFDVWDVLSLQTVRENARTQR